MSSNLPNHIAIIMDGNGRWAKLRNKSRSFGHLEGLKTAKRIISKLSEFGISYVTLYVFSTENWKRPPKEVSYLMSLITSYIKKEYSFYDEYDLKVTFTGDISGLPPEVSDAMRETEEYTSHKKGTTVNLAVNYGGRDELLRAFNRYIETQPDKVIPIDHESLSSYLDHPEIPDPDLVIRSAGEQRLSNFLIWEAAYSELYFSDKLWPDWTGDDVELAIAAYQDRTRKFGGIVS